MEHDGWWGLGVRMGGQGSEGRKWECIFVLGGLAGCREELEEREILQPAPLVHMAWDVPGRGAQEASCGLRGRMDTGKDFVFC